MKKMIPVPVSAPRITTIGSGVCMVGTGTVGTVEGISGAWIFTIPPLYLNRYDPSVAKIQVNIECAGVFSEYFFRTYISVV